MSWEKKQTLVFIPSYLKSLTIFQSSITVARIMETLILTIFACILWLSRDRNLHLENLALRQQLAILKHKNKRPKIRLRDRIFWVFFIQVLERLEKCPHRCEAGNSNQLAQKRIQTVLGV
jgi:hypothetical protein